MVHIVAGESDISDVPEAFSMLQLITATLNKAEKSKFGLNKLS
jgi:hypothetical protein